MANDRMHVNPCKIISLPDSVLLSIASFADPPAIYNLAQTCSKFHRPSVELSPHHILTPHAEVKSPHDSQYAAVPNVAARLLRESLIQGLLSAMQRSNAAITTDQARDLAKLQVNEMNKGRKVLLSGSTAVQAATGKRFDNHDIDIYCSKESLPAIRKLLAIQFKMTCQSALPQYDKESIHLDEFQNIHHVETYIPYNDNTKTSSAADIASGFYRAWNAQQAALEGVVDVPVINEDISYLNWRNECLYKVQRNGQYSFPSNYPFTLSPKGNGNKGIDIIVCSSSPGETIDEFDLEICKCAFDGNAVQIMCPQNTLNCRTASDESTELINLYMSHFLKPPDHLASKHDDILADLQLSATSNDMMIHIMQCFLATASTHKCKLPLVCAGLGLEANLLHPNTCWKINPRYFLALHNKLIKRLRRALKYSARGIDVPINASLKQLFLGEFNLLLPISFFYIGYNSNTPRQKRVREEYICCGGR